MTIINYPSAEEVEAAMAADEPEQIRNLGKAVFFMSLVK